MQPLLILFAKAPVPGRVKTRLQTVLTAEEASALHEAFVEDTLEVLASLGEELEIHVDRPTGHWPEVRRRLQVEGDLGARMRHAIEQAKGYAPVVIVGSDAPDLPAELVRELMASTADVTLGPAEDGGYYAVACRRSHAAMFDGVNWSTKTALEDTVRACRQCGLSVGLGRVWHDVDEPGDLERLVKPGPRTRAWLAGSGKFRQRAEG